MQPAEYLTRAEIDAMLGESFSACIRRARYVNGLTFGDLLAQRWRASAAAGNQRAAATLHFVQRGNP